MRDPYDGLSPRQAAVRRYFTPPPDFPSIIKPAIAAGIGLILIVSGLGGATFITLVGFIVVAVAAIKATPRIIRYNELRARSEPKPSDHQMDQWLADAIGPMIDKGFDRLDIARNELVNPAGGPLVVVGFPDRANGHFRLARGKDGQVRASHYDILAVYLTEWRLSTYQCVLDMETGAFVTDQTREFHYRDIVSVATSSDRVSWPLPIDHARPRAASATGNGGNDQESKQNHLEITTSQWFRLRVASDEIAILVGLFDVSAYGEKGAVDNALSQIRGQLRRYTRLHEPGGGAFDDLHANRRRGDGRW
jgi:hypothetical protein